MVVCDVCARGGSANDESGFTPGDGWKCPECRNPLANETDAEKRATLERSMGRARAVWGVYNTANALEDVLVDMLTDLMHLADAEDVDFAECFTVAAKHRDSEKVA